VFYPEFQIIGIKRFQDKFIYFRVINAIENEVFIGIGGEENADGVGYDGNQAFNLFRLAPFFIKISDFPGPGIDRGRFLYYPKWCGMIETQIIPCINVIVEDK
jgi:hypothetical protein